MATASSSSSSSSPLSQSSVNDFKLTFKRVLMLIDDLPFTVVRGEGDQQHHLEKREVIPGGVDLLGLKDLIPDIKFVYIGWPGVHANHDTDRSQFAELLTCEDCVPVFMDETIKNDHDMFCNNILLPFFNNNRLQPETTIETNSLYESLYRAHRIVNELFATKVVEHYKEGDAVWCHGRYFFLTPQLIKEKINSIKVMSFLYTPSPSGDMFLRLPPRHDLLKSIIAADLVGFRTSKFARQFVTACNTLFKLEETPGGVMANGKLTVVDGFRIGIDSGRFSRGLKLAEVQNEIETLRAAFYGRKVILGVDILDDVRGIEHKIAAYEEFRTKNPSWKESVVFIQCVIPTRNGYSDDSTLLTTIRVKVGGILGTSGIFGYGKPPIIYRKRHVKFQELCALYAIADVALVTSIIDDMNLVSHEFVACQGSNKGVLILSKFAGDAKYFREGAILVNPCRKEKIASAICQALNMLPDERERRHNHNIECVNLHTTTTWAKICLSALDDRRVVKDAASSTSTATST